MHEVLIVVEDNVSFEHSARSSTGERASASRIVHYDQLGKPSNLLTGKQHCGSYFVRENL